MIFFWQVDILIWEVDINNLQVNMKIWQVDIIMWLVMAEICDHRCQTDINMSLCLLTLKSIKAKHIISYIVPVWHIQVIRRHLVSFGFFPLRRCLFLFIFTYLFILWFYLSCFWKFVVTFSYVLSYIVIWILNTVIFLIIFHTFYP